MIKPVQVLYFFGVYRKTPFPEGAANPDLEDPLLDRLDEATGFDRSGAVSWGSYAERRRAAHSTLLKVPVTLDTADGPEGSTSILSTAKESHWSTDGVVPAPTATEMSSLVSIESLKAASEILGGEWSEPGWYLTTHTETF